MEFKFEGKWKYQSYRPEPVAIPAAYDHQFFKKWSPPGDVTIVAGDKSGTLEFKKPNGDVYLTLNLTCTVTQGNPARVSVTAVGKLPPTGAPLTNELQGYVVLKTPGSPVDDKNPLVVRGMIVQTSESDVPANTVGYFVLEPVK
jgi:hypothetical protein